MARPLTDGEERQIKVPGLSRGSRLVIKAFRMDADTPFVKLSRKGDAEDMIWLTDTEAEELHQALGRALAILPSSK